METPPVNDDSRLTWLAWTTRAIAAIVVLVAMASIAGWLGATAPKSGDIQSVAALPQTKVFAARPVPMRRQWRGYGVAASRDRADVPSRITATVATIPPTVQAGRPIKFNDIIATLDGSEFINQLEVAVQRVAEIDAQLKQIDIEAQRYKQRLAIESDDVKLAGDEVARLESLFKVNAAKQFEIDAAKRSFNSAQRQELTSRELLDKIEFRKRAMNAIRDGQEASRKIAKENLDRCEIKSPIDGVLQSVDVKVGESLAPGQRVARVVSLGRIEVPVQLPVAARQDIIVGGRVELRTTNDTDHCWDATITRLAPEDDPTTRTMTAYVEVDQTKGATLFGTTAGTQLLTPGQFVGATAWSDVMEPRWVVPRRSIRAGRVLTIKDGIVVSKPVTIDFLHEGLLPQTGVPDDQWAVLANNTEPLTQGELIVLNASVAVRDGDKVEPVE